jgi:predicted small metal-binding protein
MTSLILGNVPISKKLEYFYSTSPRYIRMKKLACHDVGLDCDFVIEGTTEEEVIFKAQQHAYDIHAIRPEEMTSEMKIRVRENIRDT